jgi:hypothetical protein
MDETVHTEPLRSVVIVLLALTLLLSVCLSVYPRCCHRSTEPVRTSPLDQGLTEEEEEATPSATV